jgi:hypothetical protein
MVGSGRAARIHPAWLLLVGIAMPIHGAQAGETVPLPFAGLFESRGGFAREKVADGQWRQIPQDVQLLVVRDADIVELRIRIEVSPDAGSAVVEAYTIANDTWLVGKSSPKTDDESDRVEFDVYKKSPDSGPFEDKGDGFCTTSECRYSYITAKPGHSQRYYSHITWEPGREGIEFRQSGGLSSKAEGDLQWTTFKTWDNRFKRAAQSP